MLPDEALLTRFEEQRGHGATTIWFAWRATVVGIVLQHESSES